MVYLLSEQAKRVHSIYTDRAISDEVPVKYKRIFYSWNGQKYGIWPNTPHPKPNTFFPRNKLKVNVQSSISNEDTLLLFHYIVSNNHNSLQGINDFYISSRSKWTKKHTTKPGWKFSDRNRTNFFFWLNWGIEPNVIRPGESDTTFSYSINALPFISRYYIQGANKSPTNASFKELVEDIKTNSVSGYTLGPTNPPDPFDAGVFTDTLRSFTTQACKLKWIDNKGICQSLLAKLKNVQNQLGKGKTKIAITSLWAFINEVEAQKGKHLTGEGFGLLYFNVKYLIKKLGNQ
jgi:hypothetical protein